MMSGSSAIINVCVCSHFFATVAPSFAHHIHHELDSNWKLQKWLVVKVKIAERKRRARSTLKRRGAAAAMTTVANPAK
jgi:hypothetical protein